MKRILSVLGLSILLSCGTVAFAQTESHNHSQSDQAKQTVTKSDGSMVEIVIAPDGTKTEIRTFKTGDIARITRTTQTDGTRTVMVEYRDSRQVDLTDENDIEQAMDATADMMLTAADKAWSVTKKAGEEVADKMEDVADKTVDTAKKVGEKTKDVAEKTVDKSKEVGKEVADKTEDIVDKTVDVSKKAGKEVADKSEDVADKTVDTSKKVAVKGVKVTKEAGEEVADKTEDVADKTVDVTKEGAKESVSWTRKVGRGFKKVGGWFKDIFN